MKSVFAIITLALVACAAPPVQTQAEVLAQATAVTVEDTEYDSSVLIRSGSTNVGPGASYRLGSAVMKRAPELRAHMLNFGINYSAREWMYWNKADTNRAESLKTETPSRKVHFCSRGECYYTEMVHAHLPEKMLREIAAGEKIKIRVSARTGAEVEIDIPQAQAKAMLDAADQATIKYKK